MLIKMAVKMKALLIMSIALLTACTALRTTPTTTSLEVVYTAAAETISARMTLAAGGTAVAQLTELAHSPTPTIPLPVLPSLTAPPPTATAIPATPSPPTPTLTATPDQCNAAAFVTDVTVPAFSAFPTGARFTKVWRLRNAGTCTWNSAYNLTFTSGDRLGSVASQPLTGLVRPGEAVDVAIDMTAPTSPGVYSSGWMLSDADGRLFGVDSDNAVELWVQIQVLPSDRQRFAYDLGADYCTAQWRNLNGLLLCPGFSNDPGGSVILLTAPNLERGQEDELALWVRPSSANDAWISGEYPSYLVQQGDYFLAELGCLADSPGCALLFTLDYRRSDGVLRNLGTWREVSDRQTTEVDLSLDGLAGQRIQLMLSVYNEGVNSDANAFWLLPRIQNEAGSVERVMLWRQERRAERTCQELLIYLYDGRDAEAQAYNCQGNRRLLGDVDLDGEELSRLLGWVRRLASYEGQVYEPGIDGAVTTSLIFSGGGNADASSADIQDMETLAESLYHRIAD